MGSVVFELVCKICKDKLTPESEPYFLPCGDSFCKQCLVEFNITNKKKTVAKCVACDKSIDVPLDFDKLHSWKTATLKLPCEHEVSYDNLRVDSHNITTCSTCDLRWDISILMDKLTKGCVCGHNHTLLKNCVLIAELEVEDFVTQMNTNIKKFNENLAVTKSSMLAVANQQFKDAFDALLEKQNKFNTEYAQICDEADKYVDTLTAKMKKRRRSFVNMKVLNERMKNNPALRDLLLHTVQTAKSGLIDTTPKLFELNVHFSKFTPLKYRFHKPMVLMQDNERTDLTQVEYKLVCNYTLTCNHNCFLMITDTHIFWAENEDTINCISIEDFINRKRASFFCNFEHTADNAFFIPYKDASGIVVQFGGEDELIFKGRKFEISGTILEYVLSVDDDALLIKVNDEGVHNIFVIDTNYRNIKFCLPGAVFVALHDGNFLITTHPPSGNAHYLDKKTLAVSKCDSIIGVSVTPMHSTYVGINTCSEVVLFEDNKTYTPKGPKLNENCDYYSSAPDKYFLVVTDDEVDLYEMIWKK
jgi:hypothetical protein